MKFPKAIAAVTELIEATQVAIYQEGLAIMAKAARKTPVRHGRLRASAFVAPPEERRIESTIGYGVNYAIYVHEGTHKNFTVGEAKFLEKAMNERSRGWDKRMAKRIKENRRMKVKLRQVRRDFPEKHEE